MRVAVIGCGYWGSKHVRVLSSMPSVDLVVAVDQKRDRTDALQRQFPGLLALDTVDEALDYIDAAVIATSPVTHAPLASRLIQAGKHVLVEKPMTTNSADAARLVEQAEKHDVVLMAGHTFEYNAAVHHLRGLIKSGELGHIYYIDTARLNLGLYQPDVNCVWDLAPHDVSILNYILDSQPTQVSAWASTHAGSKFHDVAYLRLEYGDIGTSAQVHVSWLDPCKVRRVTVVGSRRMAVYNDLQAEEPIRVYDKGVSAPPEPDSAVPMSYRNGDISLPHVDFVEPLLAENTHFVECVLNRTPCRTDGRSGMAVVKTLEAANESIRTGAPVTLTEATAAAAAVDADPIIDLSGQALPIR
jgi:predicted dehydrogenase